MLRGLLLLALVVVIVAVVLSLLRRGVRRSSETSRVAQPSPAPRALPAAPAAATGALGADEALNKLLELAFDAPVSAGSLPSAHEAINAATSATLASVATDPRYALRRPMLLPQLMRAVNDTDTTRRELANIIARDPALAGNLLRLANSPFYRTNSHPVESIDRAVVILGTEGIRSLIATAVMQPVFRVAGGAFARFPEVIWEHTYRAGAAAEAHAAIIENSDPFAAQLLGMLMGLGSIVVFRAALDQYTAHSELSPDAAVIAALLNSHTAEVAGRIATSWDLSGRILAALEDQYVPMHEPTALGRSLRFGRLAGALAVLEANKVITDDVAKATMLATGASGPQIERIWSRLTARSPAADREPPARARPGR